MKKFRNNIFKTENAILIFIFSAVFFVLFLQFFTRYVLNNSLGWTEEIARMILICFCFAGAVINAREGSEVKLEFLESRLSRKNAILLDVFVVKPLCIILYFFLAFIMTKYAMKANQYLSTIKISKKYIISFVAFCFYLMSVHSVYGLIKKAKELKSRETI